MAAVTAPVCAVCGRHINEWHDAYAMADAVVLGDPPHEALPVTPESPTAKAAAQEP